MLEQTCRTCLATSGELVSIFSNDYYVNNLADKLFQTIRIEVQIDDQLPKMICKKCIFLVDSLCCFKDQCEMAEIKLKKTLTGETNNGGTSQELVTSEYNDKSYNKYILEDHSTMSSSEEDYDIEYVSEEARREVENARRRSRNAKKKRNKRSGVKVKSVEILPSETKDNLYKNFNTNLSDKCSTSEIQEEVVSLISDTDSRCSSNRFLRNPLSLPQTTSTTEKINFYKSMKREGLQDVSEFIKPGFKRKLESYNSYSQLSKVPKKVMFKDEYGDENMQMIEVSENQDNTNTNTSPMKVVENDLIQINFHENSTKKVVQNYDLSLEGNDFESSKVVNENKKEETQIESLMKHVVLNIPEICAICSESFESYLDVLKHKIKTHLNCNQDYFFCPICHDKFFSNESLVDHLNIHKDVHSFVCILCSGNFYTEKSLRTHLHTHVDLEEIKCQTCSKRFQRFQTLLTHLNQHVTAKQLICTLCSEKFSKKDALQKHIDNEHTRIQESRKSKCLTCNEIIPKDEMDEHLESHKTYPCPYCERNFSTKNALREHVFTHLGVQHYLCLICENTFNSQEERTEHMQVHLKPEPKSDKKKFRCRVCHEILVSRVAYGEHLKEKHWNAKQTSEILRELSESSMNDKINDQSINLT